MFILYLVQNTHNSHLILINCCSQLICLHALAFGRRLFLCTFVRKISITKHWDKDSSSTCTYVNILTPMANDIENKAISMRYKLLKTSSRRNGCFVLFAPPYSCSCCCCCHSALCVRVGTWCCVWCSAGVFASFTPTGVCVCACMNKCACVLWCVCTMHISDWCCWRSLIHLIIYGCLNDDAVVVISVIYPAVCPHLTK